MTVDIAFAYYETKNGKPHHVFRIEASRFRVLRSGAMDRKYESEGLQLLVNSIGSPFSESKKRHSAGNVVDASPDFNNRRRKARHTPDLSPKVARKIVALLGV
jgi:hypothetical protein